MSEMRESQQIWRSMWLTHSDISSSEVDELGKRISWQTPRNHLSSEIPRKVNKRNLCSPRYSLECRRSKGSWGNTCIAKPEWSNLPSEIVEWRTLPPSWLRWRQFDRHPWVWSENMSPQRKFLHPLMIKILSITTYCPCRRFLASVWDNILMRWLMFGYYILALAVQVEIIISKLLEWRRFWEDTQMLAPAIFRGACSE